MYTNENENENENEKVYRDHLWNLGKHHSKNLTLRNSTPFWRHKFCTCVSASFDNPIFWQTVPKTILKNDVFKKGTLYCLVWLN